MYEEDVSAKKAKINPHCSITTSQTCKPHLIKRSYSHVVALDAGVWAVHTLPFSAGMQGTFRSFETRSLTPSPPLPLHPPPRGISK
ncbi:hypothetical protein ElyMa_006168900, partial [Elysia marginata]